MALGNWIQGVYCSAFDYWLRMGLLVCPVLQLLHKMYFTTLYELVCADQSGENKPNATSVELWRQNSAGTFGSVG